MKLNHRICPRHAVAVGPHESCRRCFTEARAALPETLRVEDKPYRPPASYSALVAAPEARRYFSPQELQGQLQQKHVLGEPQVGEICPRCGDRLCYTKAPWIAVRNDQNHLVGMIPWSLYQKVFSDYVEALAKKGEQPHHLRCINPHEGVRLSWVFLKPYLNGSNLRAPVRDRKGSVAWGEYVKAYRAYKEVVPDHAKRDELALDGGFFLWELEKYLGRSPRTYTDNTTLDTWAARPRRHLDARDVPAGRRCHQASYVKATQDRPEHGVRVGDWLLRVYLRDVKPGDLALARAKARFETLHEIKAVIAHRSNQGTLCTFKKPALEPELTV